MIKVTKTSSDLGQGHLGWKAIQDQIDVQQHLNKLKQWIDKYGMELNPLKCKVMKINCSKQQIQMFDTACDWVLKQADQAKYLGIMMSND